MHVLKFGGTSVGSAENLSRVLEIVRAEGGDRPVVVVSAHSGVTDELLRLARAAVAGRYSMRKVRRLHRELYTAIGVDFAVVEPLLDELNDLLRGLKLVGELTPRSLDLVASFGEEYFPRLGITYDANTQLYKPKGCDECAGSGFRGRMAIHEMLVCTDEIKAMIQEKDTELLGVVLTGRSYPIPRWLYRLLFRG